MESGPTHLMPKPQFLNEGSYGCVHRPPIVCKVPIKMKRAVSKLMTKADIQKELGEYERVNRVDPKHQYSLDVPKVCDIAPSAANLRAIKQCEMHPEVLRDLEKYQILVMKDGGKPVHDYLRVKREQAVTPQGVESVERFWIEMHRILLGVRAFLSNGLTHHDLSTMNIMYDEPTRRANIIDFGKMEKIAISRAECQENAYQGAINWAYYPFESILLNKSRYITYISQMSSRPKIDAFIAKNAVTSDQWLSFFQQFVKLDKAEMDMLVDDFAEFLQSAHAKKYTYNQFLDQYFYTMDIYCLGVVFLYGLRCTKKYTSELFQVKASDLFMRMVAFHPMRRIGIDELLNAYENLLETTGIMKKHRLVFHNHGIQPRVSPTKKPVAAVAAAAAVGAFTRKQMKPLSEKRIASVLENPPMSDKSLSRKAKTWGGWGGAPTPLHKLTKKVFKSSRKKARPWTYARDPTCTEVAQFAMTDEGISRFDRQVYNQYDCVINALQVFRAIDAKEADLLRIVLGDQAGISLENIGRIFIRMLKYNFCLLPTSSYDTFIQTIQTNLKVNHGVLAGWVGGTGHVIVIVRDKNGQLFVLDPQESEPDRRICPIDVCQDTLRTKGTFYLLHRSKSKLTDRELLELGFVV